MTVMLAESAEWSLETVNRLAGDWVWEPKLDGMRATLTVMSGQATLASRSNRNITGQFPEIISAAEACFGDNDVMLDGEIVALNDENRIDFGEVSRRNSVKGEARIKALAKTRPCFFMAFDLMVLNGVACHDLPLRDRRHALEELAERLFEGPLALVPQSDDGALVMKTAQQLGLEGVMAKLRESKYQFGGRSGAWLKLKPTHRSTFIVTGLTEGSGARSATFGSLILSLWNGEQLIEYGEVGSGFTQADLQDVLARVAAGQVLMAEVEYQEITKDGRLRFPVFRGLRDDIEFTDCSTAQLDAEIDVSHIA